MSLSLKPLGGGGHNSLKEKENEDNPQSDDDTGDSGENEITTYTYKSYYDYFIDNMDCTGVYDTDGNLTNVTISAEKKAEILSYDFTGNGTASDPYQINTTQGFWYMSKFVNLANKNVELNCDVVLNDEKFDENGNASCGDGVVYDWEQVSIAVINFNGNENTIFGLYKNDKNFVGFSIFKTNSGYISNLNFDDVFISIFEDASAVTNNINTMENVKLLKGNIKACKSAFGLIYNRCEIAENCSNYGNIFVSEKNVCGIGNNINYVKNCNNYGNVILKSGTKVNNGSWAKVGGICAFSYSIKDSNNYGEIYNINGEMINGGICGYANGTIENCNNYGVMYFENAGGYSGGICGYGLNLIIENCIFYGKIFVKSGTVCVGGIFGETDASQRININECKFYGTIDSSSSICCIAVRFSGIFSINNCDIRGDFKGASRIYLIIKDVLGKKIEQNFVKNCRFNCNVDAIYIRLIDANDSNLVISNIHLNIFSKSDTCYFALLTSYYNSSNVGKIFNIKNVFLNIDVVNKFIFSFIDITHQENDYQIHNFYVLVKNVNVYEYRNPKNLGKVYINGVLMQIGEGIDANKYYFGSNFRDFYVSWKYGTIGLKTLDGVGSAQGSITTEWLEENGWVKK